MEEHGSFAEKDPTVLEYLKGLFQGQTTVQEITTIQAEKTPPKLGDKSGLISIACFFLGQFLIEYLREGTGFFAGIFFVLGLIFAFLAFKKRENEGLRFWSADTDSTGFEKSNLKLHWLLASIAAAILSFMIYQEGRVTLLSMLLWIASIAFFLATLWVKRKREKSIKEELISVVSADHKKILIAVVAVLIVLFFQFGKISSIPTEMISAQVDSHLTVAGIRQGELSLWFPGNVVSEPLSYYWAAIVTSLFGGELTFTGLKIAYALAGLISVFYMFKLGALLFDQATGLVAALLIGVGFWPIVQQRAVIGYGLVLPILLPALYYLFKSVKRKDLNSLLLSALFTGLGLLTNKIFLILPLVSILIIVLHKSKKEDGNTEINTALRIVIYVLFVLLVSLPLLSVVLTNAEAWFLPVLNSIRNPQSTGGQVAVLVFFKNLLSATGIVNWSNRSSWVDGIANRGAVDWITGASFLVGLSLLIFSGWKEDKSKTISLLFLYGLFLIPSAISIAFPQENPSLSKALAAAVPVALIAAKGLLYVVDRLGSLLSIDSKYKKVFISALFLFLIIIGNYSLITKQYASQYQASAWNASEMAQVIKRYDTGQQGISYAYILGYPHWVDHRAVSILMGRPRENLSLNVSEIESTKEIVIPKIFIVNPFDKESISTLQSTYPNGVVSTYQSVTPEKNFLIFIAGQ